MNRIQWAGFGVVIVAILAVITVVVSTRQAPGSMSSRGRDTSAESWAAHLASVDRALEDRDLGMANRRWRDAYGIALRSQQWEPMITAGEAARRIGQVSGDRRSFDAETRQCYLTALFRARAQRSLEGVLLAADAFEELGDVAVAKGAHRMAEGLVPQEPGEEIPEALRASMPSRGPSLPRPEIVGPLRRAE